MDRISDFIDIFDETRTFVRGRDPQKFTIMTVGYRDKFTGLRYQGVPRRNIYPVTIYTNEYDRIKIDMNKARDYKNINSGCSLAPFDVILLPCVAIKDPGFDGIGALREAFEILKEAFGLLKPDGLFFVGVEKQEYGSLDTMTAAAEYVSQVALTVAMQAGFAVPTIKKSYAMIAFDFSKPVLAPEIKPPDPLLAKIAEML